MALEKLIKQIEENQRKIEASDKFTPEILKKINYKFRLDWNYYSNRMEGGTLTREETRSVMVGNISVEGKPIKDVMEMNGHDKVVLEILKIAKGEQRLSEAKIKQIHKAIMHEEDPEKAKQIGIWKTSANEIINYKNEKIPFAPPSEVPERMHAILDLVNKDLDAFFKGKKEKQHPLIIASNFHLNYVSIHPFYDGNGRTARIFTNLILIACGLPVIIIKDEHKDRYYRCLADIQAYGGNADLFYEFIGERVLESQAIVLDALAGKEIEEPDDLDKRISLLKKRAGADDKVKERKTTQSIYNALITVVFPLFKEIQTKCEEFNNLFFESYCVGSYSDKDGRVYQIKSNDRSWDMIKESWLGPQFLSQNGDMQRFNFDYGFFGFKKNVKGQSLNAYVTVWFDAFNYTITSGSEQKANGKLMSYTDELSKKEKTLLIKKVISPVVEEIERYLE